MTSRRVARVALVIALAWLVAAGVQGWLAYRDVQAGYDRAFALRDGVSIDDLDDESLPARLREAAEPFGSARARAGGILLRPVRLLPVAGRNLAAIEDLSLASERVLLIGAQAIADVQAATTGRAASGEERVAAVAQVAGALSDAERDLAAVDLGPGVALAAPVERRRTQLLGEVTELRAAVENASAGAHALLDLVSGPRRVLVLAANNAEMRAGSGMFLSVGVLETDGGAFRLGEMHEVSSIGLDPAAAPPVTGDLAARWGWLNPSHDWRNLAVTPRFDVTAPLARDMWRAVTGEEVDAVLAIDAAVVEAVVGTAGPIEAGGRTLDEGNVVDFLMHDQYVGVGLDDFEQARRRELLGEIASATIGAFDRGDADLNELATRLAEAARGRHLLVWSDDPALQAGWEALGVAGTVDESSLLLAVLNRGGNKLDYFVDVDAELRVAEARASGDGREAGSRDLTEVEVTVTVRNDTPQGEPRYVAGPHPRVDVAPGDYVGLVALTMPGDARSGRFDGTESLAVAGADGPTRVIAREVVVRRGESSTVTARFLVPRSRRGLVVEPSARIPGVRWSYDGDRWRDIRPEGVEW